MSKTFKPAQNEELERWIMRRDEINELGSHYSCVTDKRPTLLSNFVQ